MPVQINEVVIRAIITSDSGNGTAQHESPANKKEDKDLDKIEMLDLIDEVIKNKKER